MEHRTIAAARKHVMGLISGGRREESEIVACIYYLTHFSLFSIAFSSATLRN